MPGGIKLTYPESVLSNNTNYINAIDITEKKKKILKKYIYLQFKKMALRNKNRNHPLSQAYDNPQRKENSM